MRILGIDPGLTGGCAILATAGPAGLLGDQPAHVLDAIDIPVKGEDAKRRVDVLALARWIDIHKPDIAFIERAQAMPSQGSSSGFIYGRACGALEAATILAHVQLNFVEARTWKEHFKLPGAASYAREHNTTKAVANTVIKELVRQTVLRVLSDAGKFIPLKQDHGKAEAIAIAMYGADLIEADQVAA